VRAFLVRSDLDEAPLQGGAFPLTPSLGHEPAIQFQCHDDQKTPHPPFALAVSRRRVDECSGVLLIGMEAVSEAAGVDCRDRGNGWSCCCKTGWASLDEAFFGGRHIETIRDYP